MLYVNIKSATLIIDPIFVVAQFPTRHNVLLGLIYVRKPEILK